MKLSEQIKEFLEITEMPKTNFCRNAGISLTTLGNIFSGVDVSNNTIISVSEFMSRTLQKLIEISK